MGFDEQNDDPANDPQGSGYGDSPERGEGLTKSQKKFHLTVWDGEKLWHEEYYRTLGRALTEARSIERKKIFRCKVVELKTGRVRFPL